MTNNPIIIHDQPWSLSELQDQIQSVNEFDLVKTKFVAGGQHTHDHCEICWWTIYETSDEESGFSYCFGSLHVCLECYGHFVAQD